MLLVKFHKSVVRVLGLLRIPQGVSQSRLPPTLPPGDQFFSWGISKDNRKEANDRGRQPLEAPDMLTHTYNPITWELKQKDCSEFEFKANLSYNS